MENNEKPMYNGTVFFVNNVEKSKTFYSTMELYFLLIMWKNQKHFILTF